MEGLGNKSVYTTWAPDGNRHTVNTCSVQGCRSLREICCFHQTPHSWHQQCSHLPQNKQPSTTRPNAIKTLNSFIYRPFFIELNIKVYILFDCPENGKKSHYRTASVTLNDFLYSYLTTIKTV